MQNMNGTPACRIYSTLSGRPESFNSQRQTTRREVSRLFLNMDRDEKLRVIIDAAPCGMVMVNDQGVIVLVNAQVEKLFGYSREQLLGQTIEILVPTPLRSDHPKHRADFLANPKARAMGAGRDLYGQRKDGTAIPVEIGLSPLVMDGERYVVASVVDITQRKFAESTLQENLLELQRSNADLEQFAYVCSHDLQEPLRVISNYTQLLAKRYHDQLDDDANEFVEYIVDATKRMQELINDLLLYSRVQTKGQAFRNTDCHERAQTAISNLTLAIEESGANISLEPLPTILADGSQMLQVFQNLISNAIKFRAERPLQIQLSATKAENAWLFSVTDNGLGIDMKYADRIFIIFQRLHNREQYPGSGIGLAICKKIVERHGGKIWIESQPGEGTTFNFTIPCSQEAPTT